MHAKAMMCALVDLKPYSFVGDSNFRYGWRIRKGEVQGEPLMYVRKNQDFGDGPRIGTSVALHLYTPLGWDDIPDTAWDTVSDDLLAKLFNLIGATNE